MRLLIITQAIDEHDSILGFFVQWVAEFSKHATVTVVAQRVGKYTLPEEVVVHSLRKDKNHRTPVQIFRFWLKIWQERNKYDAVFVHMIPWWVVLGAPAWKLCRKPMYLWYLHHSRSLVLKLALKLVRNVFAATDIDNGAKGPNMVCTGHAIDTEVFVPPMHEERQPLIISVGRVSPAKNFGSVLEVFATLPSNYRLRIAGAPYTDTDATELDRLNRQIHDLNLVERVDIAPANRPELITLLQSATLFIHTATTGLDKAVLEAMACGCPVVSTFGAVQQYLPPELCTKPDNLLETIERFLLFTKEEQQKLSNTLRTTVVEKHSLQRTIQTIVEYMES